MNRDNWIQLGILVFGCTGVCLLGIPDSWGAQWAELKRYAPILGLLSQPLWFVFSRRSKAWGIMILNIAYTISWSFGVWLNWIAPSF
jgi:hypothetical protein